VRVLFRHHDRLLEVNGDIPSIELEQAAPSGDPRPVSDPE